MEAAASCIHEHDLALDRASCAGQKASRQPLSAKFAAGNCRTKTQTTVTLCYLIFVVSGCRCKLICEFMFYHRAAAVTRALMDSVLYALIFLKACSTRVSAVRNGIQVSP